jgi:hypothetical protein
VVAAVEQAGAISDDESVDRRWCFVQRTQCVGERIERQIVRVYRCESGGSI